MFLVGLPIKRVYIYHKPNKYNNAQV